MVALDAAGNRTITVVAPPGRIDRLKRQIPLQNRGFDQFLDAESNEGGFVAVHENWQAARLAARKGSRKREAYDRWLDDAREAAEDGSQVALKVPADVDLTADEIDAIRRYTGPAYQSLNARLREGRALDPDQERLADHLSSALAKLPAFEGTAYRGYGFNDFDDFDHAAATIYSGTFTTPAFTSTSTSSEIADDFGFRRYNVVLTIQSKTGRQIAEYSGIAFEKEVLFDRNTVWRLVESKLVGDNLHATIEEL